MTTRFNKSWLLKPEYQRWLVEVPGDSTSAKCSMCLKPINLSNMGEAAIKSHAKSSKHKKISGFTNNECSMSQFRKSEPGANFESGSSKSSARKFSFKLNEHATTSNIVKGENDAESVKIPRPCESEVNVADDGINIDNMSVPRPPPQDEVLVNEQNREVAGPIKQYVSRVDSVKAEIIWALKSVLSHFSYNSSTDITDLFRVMFPDSHIAQQMKCSSTKVSYIVCFGIAPYIKQVLLKKIQHAPCYVICFDESHNKVLKRGQMDFVVRYFEENTVKTRYLGSEYLGHSRACDLLAKFKNGTAALEPKQMLQISMDGPRVNWKMLGDFNKERDEIDDYPKLLDIGCCSLHVVHGAFRTGCKATEWHIDSLLKALSYLFDDSPAKREDYSEITQSQVFPLPFCGTRWVEDKAVAERAISIWPNVVLYVKETLKKPKSQIPTSDSFEKVRVAVLDKLIIAKLEVFVFVATMMEPYLKKYQTDAPMVPFMSKDLALLINNILSKFLKPSVLEENDSAYKLSKIEVDEKRNYLKDDDVDIGFSAKSVLTKARSTKSVSSLDVLDFKKKYIQMLVAAVQKLQERCPLKYSMVRNLMCLDPKCIAHDHTKATKMFARVLVQLSESKWKTNHECDIILSQFKAFVSDVQRYHKDEFSNFSTERSQLDSFYYDCLNDKDAWKDLWNVIKILLTLSHGQASVERGFSVNKDMLAPNLHETGLSAKRMIADHFASTGISLKNFNICEDLLKSCSHASTRYRMFLMENEKKVRESEQAKKRKLVEDELLVARKKHKLLQSTAEKLIESADKKVETAAKKADLVQMKAILEESNSSRKRSKEIMTKEIPKIVLEITEIEKKLK